MPMTLLWVQSDAAFGFPGCQRTWPLVIRDLLDARAIPSERDFTFFIPNSGDPASFITILFARGLKDATAILDRNTPINLALVGVPVSVVGFTPRAGWENALRDPVATALTLKNKLEAQLGGCVVLLFSKPYEGVTIPDQTVFSLDSVGLSEAVAKHLRDTAAEILATADSGTLAQVREKLDQAGAKPDQLPGILGESQIVSENAAQLFPDLALSARLFPRSVRTKRLRHNALRTLESALGCRRQFTILARLLRAQFYRWEGLPTMGIKTVGEAGIDLRGSAWDDRTAACRSPIELLSHDPPKPESLSSEASSCVWQKVRDLAIEQLEALLGVQDLLSPGVAGQLSDLKTAVSKCIQPDSAARETIRAKCNDLRFKLKDVLPNILKTIGKQADFLGCTLYGDRHELSSALLGLTEDLKDNWGCEHVHVASGGPWPGEGRLAVLGITTQKKLSPDRLSGHHKVANAVSLLQHYCDCYYVSLGAGELTVHSLTKAGQVELRSWLESVFAGLPSQNSTGTLVGYCFVIRDFPPSLQDKAPVEGGRA
jgi:hypothetical protein